jgi:hypothetical protein
MIFFNRELCRTIWLEFHRTDMIRILGTPY